MSDGPRDVLLIGGKADRQRVTVLYGASVQMRGEDWIEDYAIVTLAGSTKAFYVGVPRRHSTDGDWLMDKLLIDYEARR